MSCFDGWESSSQSHLVHIIGYHVGGRSVNQTTGVTSCHTTNGSSFYCAGLRSVRLCVEVLPRENLSRELAPRARPSSTGPQGKRPVDRAVFCLPFAKSYARPVTNLTFLWHLFEAFCSEISAPWCAVYRHCVSVEIGRFSMHSTWYLKKPSDLQWHAKTCLLKLW